jgi:phosphinothricin acetyltransferase
MSIRHATSSDLPAIVAIFNATIATRFTTEEAPISVESRRTWFEEHGPERHPVWVAERRGAVIGWLSLSRYSRQPAFDRSSEVSVYVAPGFHRQGVATALLRTALTAAPNLGLRTLLGYIWSDNAASLRLFEAAGFERWGFLPQIAETQGETRDTVIVGKHLTEGRT